MPKKEKQSAKETKKEKATTAESKKAKSKEKKVVEAKPKKVEAKPQKAEEKLQIAKEDFTKKLSTKEAPVESKVEVKAKPEIVEVKPQPVKEIKKVESIPPEEVKKEFPSLDEIKLFGKWSYKDLIVKDPGLRAYINLRPVVVPHTGGRYEHQRFKKADMPIVERLVNKLMRTQKGTGKKERMIKSTKIAFEMINIQTGKNPIQVLIDAIENASPREEVTRITYGGMAQLQSVDVAPMRRVDIAISNIIEGTYKKSFNNILTAEEILAKELIEASENKTTSYAIGKMQEIERVALSAR